MKTILIVLSVIQLAGIVSSAYLGGSLIAGIQDMWGGIILLAAFWTIWAVVRHSKKKKGD